MAIRTKQHKIGSHGELALRVKIEALGFATGSISADYGEDFIIYGEDDGVIEPFKIYVQVKASEKVDKYPSDWTVYEDALTVRNWILGNDLTILVRYNTTEKIFKYCIPEDEINYWEMSQSSSKEVGLTCTHILDEDEIKRVMWKARIRHYDRIVKLTQPNHFEDDSWNDIPQFKLFCFEFLSRLGVMDENDTHLSDYAYSVFHRYRIIMMNDSEFEDSADMSAIEKNTYSACLLLIIEALSDKSGYDNIGLPTFFLDKCACLMVQLVLHRTNIELTKEAN